MPLFRDTDILNEYKIREKVVAITTDGASNFKCALKKHGEDYETFDQLLNSINDADEELFHLDFDDLNNVWCPANELIDDDDDGIIPIKIPNSMSDFNFDEHDESDEIFRVHPVADDILEQVVNDLSENSSIKLPSRVDCSAHGFNSIGRTDSYNALKNDSSYATRYISVFKKLNTIWKSNSSRLGREMFDSYLNGHKIQKPHRIRWNRIYDAVSHLIRKNHPFKCTRLQYYYLIDKF